MQPLTIADIDEVERILSDPSVFHFASDDTDATPLDVACSCLRDTRFIVLKPYKDTLFLFAPVNKITYEMHVVIVKGKARKKGLKSAIKAARYLFNNTPCEKIISYIPIFHELSLTFAKVAGLQQEGLLEEAYLKDNKLWDLVVLGATKKRLIELWDMEDK